MLQKVSLSEFDRIYELMEQSFPEDEYRTYEEQKALLQDPRYSVYGMYDEKEELKAFIAVWDLEEFAFVEHFAVNPAYRNSGLGAGVLQRLSGMVQKLICLEVEPPKTELARRRIGFYERNHFFLNLYPYMQPSISKGRKAIPLCIMTSGAEVPEEVFLRMKAVLYTEIYHCGEEV